jgi:hypothetical protein
MLLLLNLLLLLIMRMLRLGLLQPMFLIMLGSLQPLLVMRDFLQLSMPMLSSLQPMLALLDFLQISMPLLGSLPASLVLLTTMSSCIQPSLALRSIFRRQSLTWLLQITLKDLVLGLAPQSKA